MIAWDEAIFLDLCLEGFFYGLYSGIFAMFLQCSSNKSMPVMAIIVFYTLCLLYVLSTATFVGDLVVATLQWHISTLSSQLQTDLLPILIRLSIFKVVVIGCSDFIAQCILIYRCWIVWGQNIRVVIIPSFLAITYLATWLAQNGAVTFVQGQYSSPAWGVTVILTSFPLSMAVNTLVTGLIVFKILKVFLGDDAVLVERTLGSTGNTKLRHIIFIIIESGMALFAIQLVRLVLAILAVQPDSESDTPNVNIVSLVAGIHKMINGIAPTIILVRVSMRLSFDDKESFKEAAGSFRFTSDPNTHRQMGSSSMPSQGQESNEDTLRY